MLTKVQKYEISQWKLSQLIRFVHRESNKGLNKVNNLILFTQGEDIRQSILSLHLFLWICWTQILLKIKWNFLDLNFLWFVSNELRLLPRDFVVEFELYCVWVFIKSLFWLIYLSRLRGIWKRGIWPRFKNFYTDIVVL